MSKHSLLEILVFVFAVGVGASVFELGYWSLLLGVVAGALFRTIWPKVR